MDSYIQIGVTALRDPVTGEALPAVPLYVREEDAEKVAPPAVIMNDVGKTLGEMFGKYVKGVNGMERRMKPWTSAGSGPSGS